jgi:hypothetical protein
MSGYDQSQAPTPAADLQALGERMLGTWRQEGGVEGAVRYEWLEGGFFLVQHVDLEQFGHRIKGIELIGHARPFGEPPEEAIRSRFYDNTGNTLDYVYELDGDELTIWGGEKGSPAYFKGTFSADGTKLEGAWTYPGGGGYQATSTRIQD